MKHEKITLALVDDHRIVIDGLISLLKGHDTFQFAFATTDPREVIEKLGEHPVDVLLTDVMMDNLLHHFYHKHLNEIINIYLLIKFI
jgi:DNA-binding NarL/FixJ family response regulator